MYITHSYRKTMKQINYIAPHAEVIRLQAELPLALSKVTGDLGANGQDNVTFEGNSKDSWNSESWNDTEE